ncbi:hypothetical protein JCM16163A_40960 [Paenibacillus sp. YK5]
MATDFRSTAGGDGIVIADEFRTSAGVSAPKVVVSGTITFDPPSLATGAVAVSTGITVTGAAIGDNIELYPPYDTQGVAAQAQVSAANTLVISLHNRSAGTVDLASGTWGVVVKRRV